jgi:hypothetical protein
MPDPTRPPAVNMMRGLGLPPDPWQIQVLEGDHRRLLLNCSRQAGKSTVVAVLSLAEALFYPGALVLLLSRSLRQSTELFRTVAEFHRRFGSPLRESQTAHELCLKHHSRIISLPCEPDTVRGFARVHMLVIDEAARVPDDLYRTVRPMLAVSNGRLICLSTPHGRRGFFYDAWMAPGDAWTRIQVPARDIPRITPEFLAEERRELGDSYFRQEYECSFQALEGLVYPGFDNCVLPHPSVPSALWGNRARGTCPPGTKVGGIDFGYRNPFAAVWGVLDRDDVLWLEGEHYCRERPLSYHTAHIPRDVMWYADPSGAADISELRCAGFKVRQGNNAIHLGVAAVNARLADGRLRILEGACPNLLMEAALYRYDSDSKSHRGETPVDEYNHALGALRYLVSRLDARKMARRRSAPSASPQGTETPPAPNPNKRPWLSIYNEALWTRLFP